MKMMIFKNKKIIYALLVLSLGVNLFLALKCFAVKEYSINGKTYQTAESVENPGVDGIYIVIENDGSCYLSYKQFDAKPAKGSLRPLGEGFYAAAYVDASDGKEKTGYFYTDDKNVFLLSDGKLTKYTEIADVPTYINTNN